MRKLIALILISLLLLTAFGEQLEKSGKVEIPGTITVCAGTGGTAGAACVSPGQRIGVGDRIAPLTVTRVFMPWDGEIRTLNISACESIASQDAVIFEYREKYLLKASMNYAYSDATAPVRTGEKLYLACATDASHVGRGIAVNVSGSDFDVLTTAGTFYPGEVVYVYRGNAAIASNKAGAATVYKTDAQSVSADGFITCVFVSENERVTKGEALFDIAMGADTDEILSPEGGIVAEVLIKPGMALTEDTPVLRLLDESTACIVLMLTETETGGIVPGLDASVTFHGDKSETVYSAFVTDVSYAPDETGLFRATLKLADAPSFLREGLGADITINLD